MADEPYKGVGSVEVEQYNGIGYNEYQGMEVKQYPGNRSEDASDRDVFSKRVSMMRICDLDCTETSRRDRLP